MCLPVDDAPVKQPYMLSLHCAATLVVGWHNLRCRLGMIAGDCSATRAAPGKGCQLLYECRKVLL